MPILEVNGQPLNYEILRGGGLSPEQPRQTLVLVHGIIIDNLASYYMTIAPAIAAAGIDVIMFDHRGHGKSAKIPSGYHLQHVVEDIRMLLDAVHDGTPVHIAGNSYGGTVAYGFALEHPDRVASMISLEAEPPTPAWADTMRETFQQAKEEIYKADAMVRAVAAYGLAGAKILKLSRRLAKETRFFEELPESATVSTETVAQLPVPVLAIYGSESWLFEQEPVMRSLLQNTTTVVVPGVSHSVLTEVPRLLEEELITWIRKYPPVPDPQDQGRDRSPVPVD